MQTCLITGGAGFIGSHLCDFLMRKGFRVLCMDNLVTGAEDNIRHLAGKPGFSFVRHDVTNKVEVDGAVDYVLHLASLASPADYMEHPIKTLKVGTLGTHNTLGLARAKGARYLFASTSEVYGDPEVNPQPESYWGHVNPVGVRSSYDESKRCGEALVMAYHRQHGLDTRIVRIFNTYGPRMRAGDGRVVPAFITQALAGKPLTVFGDGRQTRSFCYVSDMVEGIWRLMNEKFHYPVNLGNPHETTVRELADIVIRLTGSKSRVVTKKLPEDDPKVRCPDISLAASLLNWRPAVTLEEGLRLTVEYFRGVA